MNLFFFVSLSGVPIRPPIQTHFKLPLVNWVVLRNQQLRGTVFVGMNDEEVLDHVDTERFEDLFKLSSQNVAGVTGVSQNGKAINGVDSGLNRTTKRPEKKSLIDPNRHR